MSSHREAPQISKDPTADSADLYAFVSPDKPSTVTLIANYIPMQAPDGGPNFYEFADDVLYAINIDNDGDGYVNIAYQFQFKTVNNIPSSFLYNDGPITPFSKPGTKGTKWNRQQTYTLTRVDHHKNGSVKRTVLGTDLLVPPCNIGPLSTPNYAATYLPSSGTSAIHKFSVDGHHGTVFAGQRADGFYVDLGSIFDLGDLRPFESLNAFGSLANMPGVNSTAAVNVHSLALQVPIPQLVAGAKVPTSKTAKNAVIGVWTTASRQKVRVSEGKRGEDTATGPWVQVSRLGNPLINEVLIGLGDKDYWNSKSPRSDGTEFFKYYAKPLLGELLPVIYNGAFPNLAAYNAAHTGSKRSNAARGDLVAVLLSGIPNSIASGLGVPPTNVGSKVLTDQLRLNVAQPPTAPGSANILGWLGGDPAGFPNGRRVFDDVVTIEIRAVAGVLLPLVAPSFTPDGAASEVTDGLTVDPTTDYLQSFPYLETPYSGYATPATTPVGSSG